MEFIMSNETPNNETGWRNKLDELKNLPGEMVPDNNALWERLYERITPERKSRKAKWYWLAAAFLSFALLASFYFIGKTSKEIKANVGQPVAQSNPAIATPSAKAQSRKTSAIAAENTVSISNRKLDKKDKKIIQKQTHLLHLTDTVSSGNLVQAINNDSVKIVKLSHDLVVNIPAKKKLKVVHVNELGDKVEEFPSIEPNVSLHYFRVKFANQQVYTSPPSSNENTNGILELKTPLN